MEGWTFKNNMYSLQMVHVISLMKDNYNKAKICPYRGQTVDLNRQYSYYTDSKSSKYVTSQTTYCDLKIEPELNKIMERSRNEAELRYVWTEWRQSIGPTNKNTFMRYLDLANQAAERLGY